MPSHSTNLDKLLQSLMVFENGKKVPLEENEWKEKQENMPAYCNHPFWQVFRKYFATQNSIQHKLMCLSIEENVVTIN